MLTPEYTYLAIDFETTGLDVTKDEPIQVGIVHFDHTFKVIRTFQSLIKPRKPIKELKEIVRFLTGFTLEDLEHAPSRDEVAPDVRSFLDDKTILVGQNIAFDLAVLQKYIPFTPVATIDTFPLAKSFLHFLPSYALEVINEHLKKSDNHRSSETTTAHDALHDSYCAMNVFHQFVQKLTSLRHHYLLLDYVLQRSTQTLAKIIRRTTKPYAFENKQLFFPPLKKSLSTPKKQLSKELLTFPQKTTKQSLEQRSLGSLLHHIDRSQGPYILAFSHTSKLTIATHHLEQIGVQAQRLTDQFIFEPDHINVFLQQATFCDEEVLFVMKYFSQYDQGHSFLDINSSSDWKIFKAITSTKAPKKGSVTLATHYQLFEFADYVHSDETVLFFDHAWRYQQFSKRAKQPFDSLQMIQLIEQLAYKYTLHNHPILGQLLHAFSDQLTIFIGVMSTEIDKFFIGYTQPLLEVENIVGNPRFPKTTQLIGSLIQACEEIAEQLSPDERHLLEQHLHKLRTYTENLCEIEKKMYAGDKWYYVLHTTSTYTGYEEFLAQLPHANYHFLTTLKHPEYNSLPRTPMGAPTTTITFVHQRSPKLVAQALPQHTTAQYVISSSKQASQELFHACLALDLATTHTILVENITGGVGKNIYLATHSTKPVILIGGYSFYLEARAKKFDFSQVYLYNIHGALKEVIQQDLQRYAS